MAKTNIELIRQALAAAESSIKLAKQLLNDLEGAGVTAKPKAVELPGVSGIFDGENMVSENGQTFPVPANYASKSMLVVGDTLKLVEEGKDKRFKQIEHVKRHKTTGILTKKDGKWKAVTPEGSYKVLPAAVAHFGADVGSEIVLHLPANNLTVPYGAIESVKQEAKKEVEEIAKPDKLEAPAKEEKIEKVSESVMVKSSEPKKVIEKKPEPPKVAPKIEKPAPAKIEVKLAPKETIVVKPEPLKAITVEPEPKIVEAPKPVEPVVPKPQTPAAAKPTAIEITPEEDELT